MSQNKINTDKQENSLRSWDRNHNWSGREETWNEEAMITETYIITECQNIDSSQQAPVNKRL